MLRLSQTDNQIHIESFEQSDALAYLRVDGKMIMKSIKPGSNLISCRGMPAIMDLHLLALAKADIAPLYVSRPVLNARDIILWFKAQKFGDMIDPEDMHCTICYSRQPVDWTCFDPAPRQIATPSDYISRSVIALGKGPAIVLKFRSDALEARHAHMRSKGASWDYPEYQAHITLSYHQGLRKPESFAPFPLSLVLGDEIYSDIDTEKEFVEKSVRKRFTWDRRAGLRERSQ